VEELSGEVGEAINDPFLTKEMPLEKHNDEDMFVDAK